MKKEDFIVIEKKIGDIKLTLEDKGVSYIYYINAIGFYEDQEGKTVIVKLELSQALIDNEGIRETVITTDDEGAILISFEGKKYLTRVYMMGSEYHTKEKEWVRVIEFGAEEL